MGARAASTTISGLSRMLNPRATNASTILTGTESARYRSQRPLMYAPLDRTTPSASIAACSCSRHTAGMPEGDGKGRGMSENVPPGRPGREAEVLGALREAVDRDPLLTEEPPRRRAAGSCWEASYGKNPPSSWSRRCCCSSTPRRRSSTPTCSLARRKGTVGTESYPGITAFQRLEDVLDDRGALIF